MEYFHRYFEEIGIHAEVSTFCLEGKVTEWHVMMHVSSRGDGFEAQYARLREAQDILVTEIGLDAHVVFKRYFLSDSTNQRPLMSDREGDAAVSHIQQPPLDGTKVAVWLYIQSGTQIKRGKDMTIVSHNGYDHLWTTDYVHPQGDSNLQTQQILHAYENCLSSLCMSLAEHCLRTWFFCRDVDTHYAGLVEGRKCNFHKAGLTPDTHYISSTGIGGSPAHTAALVQMDAYSIRGLKAGQQQFLYALDHLNRTIEYGVTFERGTRVMYGDRDHYYISGTASIDDKGQVVHVGDIDQQVDRMWENVEALLHEGESSLDDLAQIIVYLRDSADYEVVHEKFSKRFPMIPTIITLAPVCRPTWLVEMECIAVKQALHPEYDAY